MLEVKNLFMFNIIMETLKCQTRVPPFGQILVRIQSDPYPKRIKHPVLDQIYKNRQIRGQIQI